MIVGVTAVEEDDMFVVVVGESVEKAGGSVSVKLIKIKLCYHYCSFNSL